jgi:hypothetical protein
MGFQWLAMRISEEQDRREREAWIRERMPRALTDLFESVKECIDAYTETFGAESASVDYIGDRIRITVREERGATWQPRAEILIHAVAGLPGFRIDSNGEITEVPVGVLPGDRVFYMQGDHYLTMEQLTRLILDRSLFPKLAE